MSDSLAVAIGAAVGVVLGLSFGFIGVAIGCLVAACLPFDDDQDLG